jgi:hypothetical protein
MPELLDLTVADPADLFIETLDLTVADFAMVFASTELFV